MAAGDPTGEDLCSGTTDGNTLPESPNFEEREITLGDGVELTSGRKYAIVIRATVASSVATLLWNIVADSSEFKYSDDSGSTWSGFGTYDAWFKTKSNGDIKDDGSFSGTTTFGCGLTRWQAEVFTTSSDYTITSVILKLRKATGLSPGTVTVSIRNVEGEESLPDKATNPAPTDATSDVTLDQGTITWTAGAGATSHNVYYGTTSGDLTLVSEGQEGTSFTILNITDGSPFDYTITRYWRIDEVNDDGVTEGDEWSFTTITFNVPSPGPRGFGGGGGAGGGAGEEGSFAGGAISDGQSNIKTRLVALARNKVFYEDT